MRGLNLKHPFRPSKRALVERIGEDVLSLDMQKTVRRRAAGPSDEWHDDPAHAAVQASALDLDDERDVPVTSGVPVDRKLRHRIRASRIRRSGSHDRAVVVDGYIMGA